MRKRGEKERGKKKYRVGLCDNRDISIIALLWNYRDIGFDYRYRTIMRMRPIIVRN